MARTDILLDPNQIDVIAADGPMTVGASAEQAPTIRLHPQTASLQIWDGPERAQNADSQASVELHGDGSRLLLGRPSGQATASTVELSGTESRVAVSSPSQRYGAYEAITLEGSDATIEVGGGIQPEGEWEGTAGRVTVTDAQNTRTVDIRAEGGQEGGQIRLGNSTGLGTVTIDGGTGTVVLGRAAPRLATQYTEAENGEVWLDDGTGRKYGLKAENGTVGLGPSSETPGIGLILKPEEGVFGITDENGQIVFRIDTQNEKIDLPERYDHRNLQLDNLRK